MKNAHHLGTATVSRQSAWKLALAVIFTLGLVTAGPTGALAMEPSSGVPFEHAMADAQRVVAMNSDWRVLMVKGQSMEPAFGNASLLLVAQSDFGSLEAGMVVVYRDGSGDLVAHKLVAPAAGGWVVQGLNNDRPDPGLVTAGNLQGVVFGILHYVPDSDKLVAKDATAATEVAYAKRY
jgi:hypothetical protein